MTYASVESRESPLHIARAHMDSNALLLGLKRLEDRVRCPSQLCIRITQDYQHTLQYFVVNTGCFAAVPPSAGYHLNSHAQASFAQADAIKMLALYIHMPLTRAYGSSGGRWQFNTTSGCPAVQVVGQHKVRQYH